MWWNRIYKLIGKESASPRGLRGLAGVSPASLTFIVLCLTLFLALLPGYAFAAPLSDAAGAFLRSLNIPEPARRALLENLKGGTNSVAETASGVYSFSAGQAPTDRDADVQTELEIDEADFHALRARRNLAVYMARDRAGRKRYAYEDALGDALIAQWRVTGSQSASDAENGWVMALVWLEQASAKAALDAFPDTTKLDDDYCKSLYYKRAKELFDAGRYSEALPVFKHLHVFSWADIGAYTDAAECFLKMGEREESLKLLKELVKTHREKMDAAGLKRVGLLFRQAGDRHAAFEAFKEARDRLNKEDNKNFLETAK